MNNNMDLEVGWDARQYYVKLLSEFAFRVLNSNDKDIKIWFENLADFYDISSCTFQNQEEHITDLEKIDKLLNATSITHEGKKIIFSEQDRKKRKEEAYKELRKLFRTINRSIYLNGIWMPLYKKKDLGRSVEENR